MTEHESAGRELAKEAGVFLGHIIAIMAGLVLMVAGLAMGVSLVLLPIGVPVGLVGLGIFLWGFFGRAEEKQLPNQPEPLPTPPTSQGQ